LIKLKRVYEKPAKSDGERILVERLWPRGLSKRQAKIDLWLKDVAPSTKLRKWFGHDPAKWSQFRKRYKSELRIKPDLISLLEMKGRKGPVAFIFATRDLEHNGALVLKEVVERKRR
jgi:uncharacterized protein YeaO (DUF488 family)